MRGCCAVLVAIIGLAGLLGGCGGSGKKTASSKASFAQREKALQARLRALLPLRGRLLRTNELAGFHPAGHRRPFGYDAASWLQALEIPQHERAREARRLNQLGFQGGIEELLRPTKRAGEGISLVEQFPSNTAARAELAAQVHVATGNGATEFPVGGIPGARGFAEPGDINVAFADGRCFYLVGLAFSPGSPSVPSRGDVIAAAKRLFTRLHRA